MPEINQERSVERRDSCHGFEARAPNIPQMQDQLFVALEKINHTFHLDDCPLPGTAKEKMAGLKKWRIAQLGVWQLIAAYMLCKRPYIAIGTFGPINDVEAQAMDKMQHKRLDKNEVLSRGFVSKESLADSAVLQALEAYPSQELASGSEKKALVVAFEFDKARLFLFMFLIALLGLGIGVLVAVLQNDWNVGGFIGGSVFAFVAILQGAVVSLYT